MSAPQACSTFTPFTAYPDTCAGCWRPRSEHFGQPADDRDEGGDQ